MTTMVERSAAPLSRVLRAELRWILRRPRNLLALLLLASVPVAIGIGLAMTGGPSDGNGPPVLSSVVGNGLVLPVASLIMTQTMLLPLVVAMVAADALAGESNSGTLRGLLLAPVGRIRLVAVKSAGVLVMALMAVGAVALSGVLTGVVVVGGGDLVTLSGTTLPVAEGLSRVALAAGWTALQMAAVGAIALAISSLTDHPLVVMTTTMGFLIVFGVLGVLPGVEWLQPMLLTTGWTSVMDVLRDPVLMDNLVTGSLRAGCYLLVGVSTAVARIATRDA